jgi:outer membrane lipoprotein carrier protein
MLSVVSVFFPSVLAFTLTAQPTPTAAPTPAAAAKPAVTPKPAGKPKPTAQPSAAPAAAPAAAKPADALVAKVQTYYDSSKDFSAEFVQLYTRVALSKTSESRGTLKVLKPGMMRWDYAKPEPKHFIADGKQLFVYDPEDQHVSIDPAFQLSDQGSSLSFLWGKGKLSDEFVISLGDAAKAGAPAGVALLELVPKKDATYTKLVLAVDPATGQVSESTLHETSGNTNRFRFVGSKTNTGLQASEFQFTPPPGAEVAIIRR